MPPSRSRMIWDTAGVVQTPVCQTDAWMEMRALRPTQHRATPWAAAIRHTVRAASGQKNRPSPPTTSVAPFNLTGSTSGMFQAPDTCKPVETWDVWRLLDRNNHKYPENWTSGVVCVKHMGGCIFRKRIWKGGKHTVLHSKYAVFEKNWFKIKNSKNCTISSMH